MSRLCFPARIGVRETPDLVGRINIFLDNDCIRHVLRADQAEGWVEVLCTDERGKFVLTADRQDVETKILRGAVRVAERAL